MPEFLEKENKTDKQSKSHIKDGVYMCTINVK